MTPLLAQRPRTDRAFERLYKKHVHAVYRYTLAVLHNEADAEDVTQTTFLSAYRAFQRGERPERPHNWLIKIAHNACRQRFRDSSRRPQEVEFDEALAPATTTDDDVPTATEIRRALGFLAFNQRAALVMRELEGRSYAEIAQILDVSVGAVETLIFRARRALREQLEGGLTCAEAELTLSRLQEQKLSSAERGTLRAHLRECKDCAVLERRNRAQRTALKGLAVIPLPPSLGSFFGAGAVGGGAALAGGGIGAKIAAVLAGAALASAVGHEVVTADAAKPTKRQTASATENGTRIVQKTTQGSAAKSRASARKTRRARAKARHPSKRPAHATAKTSPPADVAAAARAAGSSSSSGTGESQAQGQGITQAVGNVQRQVEPLLPKVPPVQIELPELPPVQLPPPPPLPPLLPPPPLGP